MHDDGGRAEHGKLTVTNLATGSVGIQGGYVSGNTVSMGVSSGPVTSAGFAAELAAVRDLLARTQVDGTIDDACAEAAHAELDTAEDAVEEDTPQGRSRLLLALKRLSGLVSGVTSLATKVAALIAAVGELS